MKTLKIKKMKEQNQLTLIERIKVLQLYLNDCNTRIDDLVKELEVNPNFPEQHIITKESWDNADKITHEGFIYVKYTDLMFYK
jgi:hypothetical protein